MAAQERLAEHRGPFDLEQERDLAADVPDDVDLGELVGGPADPAEVRPPLALVEPIDQQSLPRRAGSARAGRSRPACPGGGRASAIVGEQLRVLLAAAQQVVAGDQSSGVLARLR